LVEPVRNPYTGWLKAGISVEDVIGRFGGLAHPTAPVLNTPCITFLAGCEIVVLEVSRAVAALEMGNSPATV
jgi:hypothetical protein